MKVLKFAIALVLAITAFGVNAQNSDYNRVNASYVRSWANHSETEIDFGLNGIAFDYMHGFSLSNAHPLYIEVGGRLTTYFNNSDASDFIGIDLGKPDTRLDLNLKSRYLNLAIPVNFGYRFDLGNDFKIMPYVGLYGRAHLWAKSKIEYAFYKDGKPVLNEKFDSNPLKKDEDGVRAVKRFQVGWVIGANFQYKPFVFGVNFGTGFIQTRDHYTLCEFAASVGYCF